MNKIEKLFFDLQDIEVSVMPDKQYKTEKIKCITQVFNEISRDIAVEFLDWYVGQDMIFRSSEQWYDEWKSNQE